MADTMQYSFARYEQKYFLTPAQQAALLARIAPHIQRDAHARYTICNLYYDTDDWRLIRASLEKPVYKEKLRVRSYGVPADGDGVFAEIKKKYAGVVYKRRITLPPTDAAAFLRTGKSAAPLGQIGREIAWFQRTYRAEPKVFLAYDRAALPALTTRPCASRSTRTSAGAPRRLTCAAATTARRCCRRGRSSWSSSSPMPARCGSAAR